jgi:3-deoxy-manno-octulosonate cytidylyltransferase (CMP-KDO synthetase)
MKQIIVIPARMKGTRLPNKPLINILGKPMIQHVWERCALAHVPENIYVATEDDAVVDFCQSKGINCINTGPAETAIDRIYLLSKVIDADSYINVQGDEPIANIQDIKTILEYNLRHPDRVVFGKVQANEQEFYDFSKAKVVCGLDGRLLYSSRAGIPLNNKGKFVSAERAIWLYAFSKNALGIYHENIHNVKLEKIEDNEIIRFLEIGVPVYCVDVIGDSWAVDELKDVSVVEEILKKKQNGDF